MDFPSCQREEPRPEGGSVGTGRGSPIATGEKILEVAAQDEGALSPERLFARPYSRQHPGRLHTMPLGGLAPILRTPRSGVTVVAESGLPRR
jgi:hypothetical protein